MRKSSLLALLAPLAGLGGFLLRRWELASAFEPSGLPIPGAPASTALMALSALFLAAAALLFFLLCRGKSALSFDRAYACPSSVYVTLIICCGTLLMGAGVLLVVNYVNQVSLSITDLILGCLLAGSGMCVCLVGQNSYRDLGKGRYFAPLLLAPFTWCLWLVLVYQSRAGDPILLDYVYQLLAIMAGLLALYALAAFSFEKGRPALALWSGSAAVYFSAVTLADGHDWAGLMVFAFSIIYFTAQNGVLLHNLTAHREENTDE